MVYRQWEIPLEDTSAAQQAALAYWRSLPASAAGMPLARDFELMRLPADLLPTTHLVDVLNGGEDFRFRFWGSGFRAYFGYDGTGRTTAELNPLEIREPVCAVYRAVVADPRPVAQLSEFNRGEISPQKGFQRILRLPLAAPDGSVQRIASLVEFLMDHRAAQSLIEQINREES